MSALRLQNRAWCDNSGITQRFGEFTRKTPMLGGGQGKVAASLHATGHLWPKAVPAMTVNRHVPTPETLCQVLTCELWWSATRRQHSTGGNAETEAVAPRFSGQSHLCAPTPAPPETCPRCPAAHRAASPHATGIRWTYRPQASGWLSFTHASASASRCTGASTTFPTSTQTRCTDLPVERQRTHGERIYPPSSMRRCLTGLRVAGGSVASIR